MKKKSKPQKQEIKRLEGVVAHREEGVELAKRKLAAAKQRAK